MTLEDKYFSEFEITDGLNQHKDGLTYKEWLETQPPDDSNSTGELGPLLDSFRDEVAKWDLFDQIQLVRLFKKNSTEKIFVALWNAYKRNELTK